MRTIKKPKLIEKYEEARRLRAEGKSLKEITQAVDAAKSSVSVWIRDVLVTPEQRATLGLREAIGAKYGVETIKRNRAVRWADYKEEADREWPELSRDPSFMFGLALYVGEGNKCDNSTVGISNMDPGVIVKSMNFFLSLGIPSERLRVSIHIHEVINTSTAEAFWTELLKLDRKQLNKTMVQVSRASKKLSKRHHPMGVCHLRVCDTRIRRKLERWMELALS